MSSPTSSPAVWRMETRGGSMRVSGITGSARTGAGSADAAGAWCWRRRSLPVTVLNRLGLLDSVPDWTETGPDGSANRPERGAAGAGRDAITASAATGCDTGKGAAVAIVSITASSGIASATATICGAAWRN